MLSHKKILTFLFPQLTKGLQVSLKGMKQPKIPQLGLAALEIARKELSAGAKEIGGPNQGPFVEKYLAPSGLKPPQPWCAAFVSWCLMKAAQNTKVQAPFPYTARARTYYRLAVKMGLLTQEPLPGDLIVWSRGHPSGPLGHIGFISAKNAGRIQTIEGNRNDRVDTFRYKIGAIPRLLGFIRIPSSGTL